MKQIGLLVLGWCLATGVAAQEPETLVEDSSHNGGFGGPTLQFTSINGQVGVLMGGHGGWIIGHRFVVGGAGRGLVGSDVDAPMAGPSGDPLYMTFNYGGLELQYIVAPLKVMHPSFLVLLGGGTASYRGGATVTSSSFLVAEPSALVTVNITKSVHASIGAAYRLVSGTNLPWLTDGDLGAFSLMMGLEFGRF